MFRGAYGSVCIFNNMRVGAPDRGRGSGSPTATCAEPISSGRGEMDCSMEREPSAARRNRSPGRPARFLEIAAFAEPTPQVPEKTSRVTDFAWNRPPIQGVTPLGRLRFTNRNRGHIVKGVPSCLIRALAWGAVGGAGSHRAEFHI